MKNIGGARPSPLVSIIIPVYNAEKYIAETINSALNQTWPNKEIIIVDDGSTDTSLTIAKKYTNSCIKVFGQENKGASAARNKGLMHARGKYVQFLDADDLLSKNKIANQVIVLENHTEKVSVCSTVHFFDGQYLNDLFPSAYEEAFIFYSDDPIHFIINLWGGFSKNGSMIPISAWLSPISLIARSGNWNEQLTVDDDGEFFARLLLQSSGVIKTKGITYYRKYLTKNNLSAQTSERNFISRLKSITLKMELLFAVNNSFEAKAAIYKQLVIFAADTYIAYPDLSKEAELKLPNIKLAYQPPIGGRISNFLTAIFGWKSIKLLKRRLKIQWQ